MEKEGKKMEMIKRPQNEQNMLQKKWGCCDRCWNSKHALKGKMKELSACGLVCKCHLENEGMKCLHRNIESNMCPTHCVDCMKVLDEPSKSNPSEIPNGSDNKKCRCACHDKTLAEPYAHDTECCENINGFVVSAIGKNPFAGLSETDGYRETATQAAVLGARDQKDHFPQPKTMVGGTVNGHQGWCRCLYGNQPCDCPLTEGVQVAVQDGVQDGNGEWEDSIVKRYSQLIDEPLTALENASIRIIANEVSRLTEERLVERILEKKIKINKQVWYGMKFEEVSEDVVTVESIVSIAKGED